MDPDPDEIAAWLASAPMQARAPREMIVMAARAKNATVNIAHGTMEGPFGFVSTGVQSVGITVGPDSAVWRAQGEEFVCSFRSWGFSAAQAEAGGE